MKLSTRLPRARFTTYDLVTAALLLLVGLAAVLLSGCSTPQAIFKQLKDDPASARIRVMGWGVVIEVDRTAPRTNTLSHSVGSERIDVGERVRP